ncbi:bacteriocin [Xylanibacter ruminicola]|uniref:Bacteriocin-type signal sequence-containing protein n=1 Tax=Xylanibacter ruminicola TaxID=839 RepID=A0A1M6V9K2_XYLRU|nr:bacteriocin [Xylanibacter ruminicola]SHK78160.1 bacteriocin-type signal sequence-containing protein [Xylanibacter ruminicola]
MKPEENKKQQELNDEQLNEINGGLPRKIQKI